MVRKFRRGRLICLSIEVTADRGWVLINLAEVQITSSADVLSYVDGTCEEMTLLLYRRYRRRLKGGQFDEIEKIDG